MAGPFTDEEEDQYFIRNNLQNYCTSCFKTLFSPKAWENLDLQIKPREEMPNESSTVISINQIWEDMDKRRRGRKLVVENTEPDHVICKTLFGKKTKIGRKRFEEGRFKLVED